MTLQESQSKSCESAITSITLSESAARRISALVSAENNKNLRLRLSVSGGGCQGFQYGFSFDDAQHADDRLFARDGACVVIDETSLSLVNGSEIDFVEDMMGAYFRVNNPKANSTCGCGSSFSV